MFPTIFQVRGCYEEACEDMEGGDEWASVFSSVFLGKTEKVTQPTIKSKNVASEFHCCGLVLRVSRRSFKLTLATAMRSSAEP